MHASCPLGGAGRGPEAPERAAPAQAETGVRLIPSLPAHSAPRRRVPGRPRPPMGSTGPRLPWPASYRTAPVRSALAKPASAAHVHCPCCAHCGRSAAWLMRGLGGGVAAGAGVAVAVLDGGGAPQVPRGDRELRPQGRQGHRHLRRLPQRHPGPPPPPRVVFWLWRRSGVVAATLRQCLHVSMPPSSRARMRSLPCWPSQVRTHAQKYFMKLAREKSVQVETRPPARPPLSPPPLRLVAARAGQPLGPPPAPRAPEGRRLVTGLPAVWPAGRAATTRRAAGTRRASAAAAARRRCPAATATPPPAPVRRPRPRLR